MEDLGIRNAIACYSIAEHQSLGFVAIGPLAPNRCSPASEDLQQGIQESQLVSRASARFQVRLLWKAPPSQPGTGSLSRSFFPFTGMRRSLVLLVPWGSCSFDPDLSASQQLTKSIGCRSHPRTTGSTTEADPTQGIGPSPCPHWVEESIHHQRAPGCSKYQPRLQVQSHEATRRHMNPIEEDEDSCMFIYVHATIATIHIFHPFTLPA